jgi:hypothetical protein
VADAERQAKERRPLARVEIERMADAARSLLGDPDAGLSRDARLRWEGALTAIEVVLGERPSLPEPDGL